MQFKQLIALAGSLALVAAADSSDSCSFSTTIKAASGIAALNACPTLDGTITVTGDDLAAIDLSNVQDIEANLKFFNSSSVTSINLNQLEKIGGSLSVQALTQLHNIDFTQLTEVEKLELISLPSFAVINLNKGIANATEIDISDTALSSLDGITTLKTISTLNVNNNKNISSIEFPNLETVKQNLLLSFNSDECEIKLNELIWASNLTLQDNGEIQINNLTAVNGTFVLAYNSFNSIDIPSLETVGGSLQIFANDELDEIKVDHLKTIGGEFRLFNNSQLEDLGFSKLQTIKGAVNIDGDFGNFTLPALKEVDGDFSVVSTNEDFSCDDFDSLHKSKKIEGHNYNCSAPAHSSSSSSSSKSKSSSKGSSSSDSSDSSGSGSSSTGSSSSSSKKSEGVVLLGGTMIFATIVSTIMAVIM